MTYDDPTWTDVPFDDALTEFVHVSELEDLDNAKDYMKDVLDGLYGEKSLDEMERALEEVCFHLDVDFPHKLLKVQKKSPYFELGAALSRAQAKKMSSQKMSSHNSSSDKKLTA